MNSFSIKIVFFSALEKLLIEQLSIIKDDVKDLLNKARQTTTSYQLKLPVELPLKSEEELRVLENWIVIEQNRLSLVSLTTINNKQHEKTWIGIFNSMIDYSMNVILTLIVMILIKRLIKM
jgi:hypothetical protein